MKKIAYLVLGSLLLSGLIYSQTKIAIMDLQAKSGIEEMTVSTLTDVLATTLSEYAEFSIISREDIKAMVSHMQDQQAFDCDDTACLVKIGNALGVSLLVAGNIGKVGEMYVINLKVLNIEEADVQNRITEKYKGSETGLVGMVEKSARVLVGKAESSGRVEKEKSGMRQRMEGTVNLMRGKETNARRGGMMPVITSCCLVNPRLGYYINEGQGIHFYDWLHGIGRYIQLPLGLIPACGWGYKESGMGGCCVSFCWGPEAGRDFRTTRIRSRELLFLVPLLNIYPLVTISLEIMDGTTWSEVVEKEKLKR